MHSYEYIIQKFDRCLELRFLLLSIIEIFVLVLYMVKHFLCPWICYRCTSSRVFNLGIRCAVVWALAILSWLSDRLFCTAWKAIGFPYLHCAWHIFIFLASYQACVLFAYFDAETEVPEQMPVLEYWPKNTWTFWGIPYVRLKYSGSKSLYKNL